MSESFSKGVLKGGGFNLVSKIFDYLRYFYLLKVVSAPSDLDIFIFSFTIVSAVLIVVGEGAETLIAKQHKILNENTDYYNKLYLIVNLVGFFLMSCAIIVSAVVYSVSDSDFVEQICVSVSILSSLLGLLIPVYALGAFARLKGNYSLYNKGRAFGSFISFTSVFLIGSSSIEISAALALGGFSSLAYMRYSLNYPVTIGAVGLSRKIVAKSLGVLERKDFLLLLMIGCCAQVLVLTDRYFAALLSPGSISVMFYAALGALAIPAIFPLPVIFNFEYIRGRNKEWSVARYAALVFFISIPIIVSAQIFSPFIEWVLPSDSKINMALLITAFQDYIYILPFFLIYQAMTRLLYVKDRGSIVFLISLVAVLLNAILNWFFSIWLDFGVRGLVWATVSNTAFMALAFLYVYKKIEK